MLDVTLALKGFDMLISFERLPRKPRPGKGIQEMVSELYA